MALVVSKNQLHIFGRREERVGIEARDRVWTSRSSLVILLRVSKWTYHGLCLGNQQQQGYRMTTTIATQYESGPASRAITP